MQRTSLFVFNLPEACFHILKSVNVCYLQNHFDLAVYTVNNMSHKLAGRSYDLQFCIKRQIVFIIFLP